MIYGVYNNLYVRIACYDDTIGERPFQSLYVGLACIAGSGVTTRKSPHATTPSRRLKNHN